MKLTKEERMFLQGLLKLHREYYGALAGSSKCSPVNKQMAVFIETLYAKILDAES